MYAKVASRKITSKIIRGTWLVALLSIFNPVFAQEAGEFDFGENETEVKAEEKSGFSIPFRGKINADSAYQLEKPSRFIRLGPSLSLILDYNSPIGLFYGEADGRANFAYDIEKDEQAVIDEYRFVGLLREFYYKKPWANFTFSFGNIMTVMGKADVLPVINIITATDRTQSFFAKPEESRLGQNTVKLDYYRGSHQISLLFIPYPVFDRITDRTHPYSTTAGLALEDKKKTREIEGGFIYKYQYSKGAASLLAGRFNNRSPIIELDNSTGEQRLLKVYQPFWFAGLATSLALDPFLLKAEVGFDYRAPLQEISFLPLCTGSNCTVPVGVLEKNRMSAMVGFDYNAGDWGNFIFEVAANSPLEKDTRLNQNRIVFTPAFGYTKTFLRDDLTVLLYAFFLEHYRNVLLRFQLDYKFTDNITAMTQITGIIIEAFRSDYGAFENYDRVDFSLSYHFDLSR